MENQPTTAMENQPTLSRKNIMINYGLLLGVVSIIAHLLIYVFGDIYKPHWGFVVLSIAVTAIVIFMGIQKVKIAQDNYLSLGEAIKTGLGISLISAIIYGIYIVIFQHFIEPSYFENLALIQEQTILEQNPNLTDEQLERSKEMAASFNNSGVNVAITIFMSLFLGLIISVVSGMILRRTKEV